MSPMTAPMVPGRSRRALSAIRESWCMRRRATTIAAAPSGTLMSRIHRHERDSVIAPLSTFPTAPPASSTALQAATARVRRDHSGKAVVSRAGWPRRVSRRRGPGLREPPPAGPRVVGDGGGGLGRGVDPELTVEPIGLFCAGEDVKTSGSTGFGDAGRVAGDDRGFPAGDRGARSGG